MSVDTIISSANSRADAALSNANSYLNTLENLANETQIALDARYALGLAFDVANIISDSGLDSVSESLPELSTGGADSSNFDDSELGDPDRPSDSEIAVAEYTRPNVPTLTAEVPTLNIPSAPTTAVPIAPAEPGAVSEPTLEAWVDYDFPELPVLADDSIAALSPVSIEDISRTLPTLTFTAPENTFSYDEMEYSSDLRSAIETLLLGDVEDGGYGIEPSDEQALFERARDRETQAAEVAVAEVRRGTAARGFPLPTGSLLAAERAAAQQVAAALSGINREITLERSRLYVQARQFAVTQGVSWESALLTYTGAKQERALRAATSVAEFALSYFQAQIAQFNVQIALRQLDRELAVTALEQTRTRLEEYRLTLERSQTLDARNESKIRQYTAQVDAVRIAYEAQEVRDRRATVEAEIERLKLELNAQQVQVYAARVQARKDEFDAYATAVRAENLNLEQYDRELARQDRRVAAAVAENEMQVQQYRSRIAEKELLLRRYDSEIREYGARIQKATGLVQAEKSINDAINDRWRNHLQAQQWNQTSLLNQRIAQAQTNVDAANARTAWVRTRLQSVLEYNELRATSAKAALQLYEQQIAGAESALSAIATLTEAA